jgi:hypothetical protein
MTFDQLISLLNSSAPEDWIVLTPVTVERIKLYGSGDLPDVVIEGHKYLAHYRPDLDVSVAFDVVQGDGKPWEGVWSAWSAFPDRSVYGHWVDVRWRGQPVHRVLFISADGGRYFLPAPLPVTDPSDPEAPVRRWTVKASELPLVRLLHDMTKGGDTFDDGLSTAGFEIVND